MATNGETIESPIWRTVNGYGRLVGRSQRQERGFCELVRHGRVTEMVKLGYRWEFAQAVIQIEAD
jgi:hypothetical protein